MPDYFSLDDVMKELGKDEEEIKRMVSEGELRAFRDENKMKFRRDDIESLKKGKSTEPTIVMPSERDEPSSTSPQEETTDTVLDLDKIEIGADETAVPEMEISPPPVEEETTGITDHMVISETEAAEAAGVEAQETFVEEEGTAVEDATLEGEQPTEETMVEEPTETEEVGAPEYAPKTGRRRYGAAAVPAAPPAAMGWSISLVLAFIFFVLAAFVTTDVVKQRLTSEQEKIVPPSGIAKGVAGMIIGILGSSIDLDKIGETTPSKHKAPETPTETPDTTGETGETGGTGETGSTGENK